jgi:hypothetical protein
MCMRRNCHSVLSVDGPPHERSRLIMISNKSFADWIEIFNDSVLATAILNRLAVSCNVQYHGRGLLAW